MAEKRHFDEDPSDGYASKRHRSGGSNTGQPFHDKKKHRPNPESANWAKKRARTIERRLQRDPDSLPANVQLELERELASLHQNVEMHQSKKQRAYMIKKYHMIRFFERKKAARLQKQLKRRLAETSDPAEQAAIEADLHIAEVDGLYAVYHPFLEPYVSLYPVGEGKAKAKGGGEGEGEGEGKSKAKSKAKAKAKDSKGGENKEGERDSLDTSANAHDKDGSSAAQALHAPRPPLWAVMEATMREGGVAALRRLQERRPVSDDRKAGKADKGGKAGRANKTAQETAGAAAAAAAAAQDQAATRTRTKQETGKRDGKPGKRNKQDKAYGKGKAHGEDGDNENDDDDDSEDGDFFEGM